MQGFPHKSPVAKATRFDNTTNGFPSSATDVQTAIEEARIIDPQTSTGYLFDDFLNQISWSPSTSGTGALASVGGGNETLASGKHIGVALIQLGTVLSSHAALVQSGTLASSTVFGDGEAEYQTLLRIPVLATATEDYVLRFGFGTATNADHADGIYFEYNRSASTNWRIKTASNSSRTATDTSTAVTNNTWNNFRFVVNSAGTSVEYFIDNVSVGTITTNIPTTTGRGSGPNFQMTQVAVVAGGRSCFIDYFYFTKNFTARD